MKKGAEAAASAPFLCLFCFQLCENLLFQRECEQFVKSVKLLVKNLLKELKKRQELDNDVKNI